MSLVQNNQAISPSQLPLDIQEVIRSCKIESKSIVLVTGVFDILHFEHEIFLSEAKKLGNILIIGIESDFRVKEIKGDNRPINSQEKRFTNLLDMGITANVFILPDNFSKFEDHLELVKTVGPDFLAVSSHTAHLDKKREIMEMVKGKLVIVHKQNAEISSTKIINGDS